MNYKADTEYDLMYIDNKFNEHNYTLKPEEDMNTPQVILELQANCDDFFKLVEDDEKLQEDYINLDDVQSLQVKDKNVIAYEMDLYLDTDGDRYRLLKSYANMLDRKPSILWVGFSNEEVADLTPNLGEIDDNAKKFGYKYNMQVATDNLDYNEITHKLNNITNDVAIGGNWLYVDDIHRIDKDDIRNKAVQNMLYENKKLNKGDVIMDSVFTLMILPEELKWVNADSLNFDSDTTIAMLKQGEYELSLMVRGSVRIINNETGEVYKNYQQFPEDLRAEIEAGEFNTTTGTDKYIPDMTNWFEWFLDKNGENIWYDVADIEGSLNKATPEENETELEVIMTDLMEDIISQELDENKQIKTKIKKDLDINSNTKYKKVQVTFECDDCGHRENWTFDDIAEKTLAELEASDSNTLVADCPECGSMYYNMKDYNIVEENKKIKTEKTNVKVRYRVSVDVNGKYIQWVPASNEQEATDLVMEDITNVDFGELTDIEYEVNNVRLDESKQIKTEAVENNVRLGFKDIVEDVLQGAMTDGTITEVTDELIAKCVDALEDEDELYDLIIGIIYDTIENKEVKTEAKESVKEYTCIEDRQGGDWAVGDTMTAEEWGERAAGWAYADNWEDSDEPLLKNFKTEQDCIDFICDIWEITIVPSNDPRAKEFLSENKQVIVEAKLTDADKKLLADWGEDEEGIAQIERALNQTKFTVADVEKDENGNTIIPDDSEDKVISAEEARKILGDEKFLSGLDRSAFHWTSGRYNDDETKYVSFDSSKLFKESKQSNVKTISTADLPQMEIYELLFNGYKDGQPIKDNVTATAEAIRDENLTIYSNEDNLDTLIRYTTMKANEIYNSEDLEQRK